jgi:hypothetical protein
MKGGCQSSGRATEIIAILPAFLHFTLVTWSPSAPMREVDKWRWRWNHLAEHTFFDIDIFVLFVMLLVIVVKMR